MQSDKNLKWVFPGKASKASLSAPVRIVKRSAWNPSAVLSSPASALSKFIGVLALGIGTYKVLTTVAAAAGIGSKPPNEIPQFVIDEIKHNFEKHAKEVDGRVVMDFEGFLQAMTHSDETPENLDKQFRTLFSLADIDKDSFLTFDEFLNFEMVMTGPEADYKIAFELFDSNRNGLITLDEFKNVLDTTRFSKDIPFDIDCEWVRSFFGDDGKSSITYNEFTQLLKGLDLEVLRQAFHTRAKEVPGNRPAISAVDLQEILLSSFSQRIIGEIPDEIRNNFARIPNSKSFVTFSEFMAIYNVLMNVDRVREGIIQASDHKRHPQVTRSEFLRVARRLKLFEFTPLEADVVFKIFDVDSDGLISVKDYERLFPDVLPEPGEQSKTMINRLEESLLNFGLGSIAGATGAAAVYPIDLVKTRMQNQRYTNESEKLYKNSWDCFRKVLSGEGFRGLYKGLGPQLIGVAPEKAIKLTVNDFLRGLFGKPGGDIYLPLEILAGGCAGASQVIFTNPIEIVKIRLQVQGESVKFGVSPKSTGTIIRELGFTGLYKGAPACLLRDIPFSAIYFPAYAKCKVALCNPKEPNKDWNLLVAGAIAGIPAASLVTPADVIKTRLQVEARTGQHVYQNIPHCASTIWKTEGFRAFWKGAGMRVFRSSPQFGVTLWSYEKLQSLIAPDMARPNPPTNAPVHSLDYDRMVRGGVGRSLRRTDQRWGLFEQSNK